MIINHNISALNTFRQLSSNNVLQNKSLEKLSSGFRINRAGDDAAGLAISEKMRGQIRGLEQASRNAQDGISLIQTAEGALNETHAILQRMRELAVQSSNDTNIGVDRAEIQKEMDQLAEELTRVTNDTEFNQQTLLNGGINDNKLGRLTFHIGANANQDIKLSINAMDAATLGVARDVKGATVNDPNATQIASVKADDVDVAKSLAAGTYTVSVATGVAGAVVDAGTTGITGITATGTPTADFQATFTYNAAVDAFEGNNQAMTHDVGSGAATASIASGTFTGTADETDLVLTRTGDDWDINGEAVTASVNSFSYKGLTVTLSDIGDTADGDVFTFSGTITAAKEANWTTSAVTGVTLNGSYATDAADIDANGVTIDLSGATDNDDGESITITGYATGVTTVQLFDTDGTTSIGSAIAIDKANGGEYTIGNTVTGQMKVKFDPDKATVGQSTVTVATNESKAAELQADNTMSAAVSYGGINVSTQSTASKAITTIQRAIENVSAERSKLGAFQNRLEHTINNLGASAENLTAAESRIRDVDMAKEMMEFTKMNILSQAATAMLAQANQQPQMVLQLLR